MLNCLHKFSVARFQTSGHLNSRLTLVAFSQLIATTSGGGGFSHDNGDGELAGIRPRMRIAARPWLTQRLELNGLPPLSKVTSMWRDVPSLPASSIRGILRVRPQLPWSGILTQWSPEVALLWSYEGQPCILFSAGIVDVAFLENPVQVHVAAGCG